MDFEATDDERCPTLDALAVAGPGMPSPLVSVLMPVRNGERFLEAALASLKRQTLRRFEAIVVDNMSDDGTAEMLARWAEREPWLRTMRCAGQLAECLNRAAALARAPFLARLDADDIAHPERLAVQYAAMARSPEVGVLGTAVELIDARGRRLGVIAKPARAQLGAERTRRSPLINSSTMMRAEAFRRAGGYRKGLNICEDADLWSRMIEFCEVRNLPRPLTRHRVHRSSLTARKPARMAIAVLCVEAAAEARRVGLPEPFRAGTPRLRAAQPLLAMSRREAVRRVTLLAAARRASAGLYGTPLPATARWAARRLLLASQAPRLFWSWFARRKRRPAERYDDGSVPDGSVGGIHSPSSSTCGGRYERPSGICSNTAPASSVR